VFYYYFYRRIRFQNTLLIVNIHNIMSNRRELLTLVLLLLAVFTTAQQAPTLRQVTLPSPLPFNTITHCLPINLVITPSNDPATYEVFLRAEPVVIDALSLNVTGTTLAIESTTADFSSTQPIQIIVRLPSTSILALNHFGPGSDVYIAPGFNTTNTTTPGGGNFTVKSGFSSGQLYVNNMNVPGQLNVQSSGLGSTIFTGTYGTVNAAVDGTGGMYISNVTQGASLNMGGVANAFIETSDDGEVGITGVSTGINRVVYSGTGARCEVSSPFGSFIQTCERAATIPIPPPLPTYTCGVRVEGEFICSLSGVAYRTSPTGGTAVSNGPGSQPVTTQGFTPILPGTGGVLSEGGGGGVQFQAPGQEQAGSVGEGGSIAQSAARGTGAVSAVSVAGPGVAQTGTTVGGETIGFQAPTTRASVIRQSTDDGGAVISASAAGLVCQAEDFSELRVPLSGIVSE